MKMVKLNENERLLKLAKERLKETTNKAEINDLTQAIDLLRNEIGAKQFKEIVKEVKK